MRYEYFLVKRCEYGAAIGEAIDSFDDINKAFRYMNSFNTTNCGCVAEMREKKDDGEK